MDLRHSRRSPKSKPKGLSKALIVILVGAIAVISFAVLSLGNSKSANSVHASSPQKKYRGTRPIVVDQQTGQRRLPTQEEVDQTVASLSALANRQENLTQASGAGGGISIDLEGGYAGVMLARPNEDGTWETRCVFTFEEGAEFLGLVEEFQ